MLAQESELTVRKIMQDPDEWIGAWPNRPAWAEHGKSLYFYWNPKGEYPSDSLYEIYLGNLSPEKVPVSVHHTLPPRFSGWEHGKLVYNPDYTQKVFARDGDLFLYHIQEDELIQLTSTREVESSPRFTPDGKSIVFRKGNNLYGWDLDTGGIRDLSDIRPGKAPEDAKPGPQESFLEDQEAELIAFIKKEIDEEALEEEASEKETSYRGLPSAFYLGKKRIQNLQIDPAETYITVVLQPETGDSKRTEVQDYVTESGYAEVLSARPKVGQSSGAAELHIQDMQRDTTYSVDLHQLPGAYDTPAFKGIAEQPVDSSESKRILNVIAVEWSADGAYCVLEIRAADNKTRWLASLDASNGSLKLLDKQQDDAWIAGPGIGWSREGSRTTGWMPDNVHYYFQSEVSGYSHLYVVNAETGKQIALTEGEFEVYRPQLSKDGSTWYFSSSEQSPFERHFYSMPAAGGERTQLTERPGNHSVLLSPDEEQKATLYSYSNKPPELFLELPEEAMHQLTHSPTEDWEAYSWRDPEIITIPASDGIGVPARMYAPEAHNGAAVLFVHGAGYLQNVHKWWSGYYREYMFHNLLADLGYVVLDVDFRASAGYGRDWRTAVYRHMGGRDLQDYVDASQFVNERYNVDPERVFIYGGSYGGFITLMALFTEPEHFGAGAALRAVTDWAHYNHPYTSNILNTPAQDSVSFKQSSPIYFAEGLEDPLLIAHGMVDTNVQFQDVVRLAQRLIELEKEDWEMALYPVEGHGFTEPSSWADEYRRILELIKRSVGPDRDPTLKALEE